VAPAVVNSTLHTTERLLLAAFGETTPETCRRCDDCEAGHGAAEAPARPQWGKGLVSSEWQKSCFAKRKRRRSHPRARARG
jgi:hypothetical protein